MRKLIMNVKKALTGMMAVALMVTAMPVYSFADEVVSEENECSIQKNTYDKFLYNDGDDTLYTLLLYTEGGEFATGTWEGWGNGEYYMRAAQQVDITMPRPIKEGYEFEYWISEDGKKYHAGSVYKLTEDTYMRAQWKESSSEEETSYILRLSTDGGVISGGSWEYYERTNSNGTKTTMYYINSSEQPDITLPTPVKEGYDFEYWISEDGTTYPAGAVYKLTKDLNLRAQWKQSSGENVTRYNLTLFCSCAISGLSDDWEEYTFTNDSGYTTYRYDFYGPEGTVVTLPIPVYPNNNELKFVYWEDNNSGTKYQGTCRLTQDLQLHDECRAEYSLIKISAPTTSVEEKGGTLQLSASFEPNSTYLRPRVTWSSSDTGIAMVSDKGVVTGVSQGKVTINASATTDVGTNLSDSIDITVTEKIIPVENIIFDHDSNITVEKGKTEKIKATVIPDDAEDKTVVWSSTNEAVATVDDGLITGVGVGTTSVTAKAGNVTKTVIVTVTEEGSDNNDSQDMTDLIEDIGPEMSFDDLVKDVVETTTDTETGETKKETKIWVGGIKSSYTYTGNAIRPEIHVYDGIRELASSDYKVTYNDNKNVGGKGQIKITFKGNYADTPEQVLNFTISPANLGSDFTVGDIAATETGKILKIDPKVMWNSTGKELKKSFYKVSFKDSNDETVTSIVKEGKYTAIIEPDDTNFTGQAKAVVTVLKKTDKGRDLSKGRIELEYSKTTWTGRELTPSVTLKDSEGKIVSSLNYTVEYLNNINPGQAAVIVTAVEGNEGGFVGSKSATFNISKGKTCANLEIAVSDAVYSKAGSKASVRITDRDTGNVLKEGKDYSLSYSNNKSVTGTSKTAVAKITGKGEYKFTETRYFAIAPQDIAKLTITVDDVTNASKWNSPKVTITDGGKKLGKNDYEYKIIPQSLPEDGVVTLQVTGKGNYNNHKDVTYKVISADKNISKAKTLKDTISKEYTGESITLSASELNSLLPDLTYDRDYEVSFYSNNIKKGTASVTLKGIGEYGGTKVVKFKIVQKKGNWNKSGKKLVDGQWTD